MNKVSEARAEQKAKLEEAVKALQTSEGWANFLRASRVFRSYSFYNRLLIASQTKGTASRVAGFRAWQKLNRVVVKGQKAIKILAPIMVKEQGTNGEVVQRCVGFRFVSVFDISQTQVMAGKEDLATSADALQPAELTGDSHIDAFFPLVDFAKAKGIKTHIQAIKGGADGYYTPAANSITLNQELAANGRVSVMVHELAHALGINYDIGRDCAEVLAESVAFIVCGQIGLETKAASVPYIAGWGGEKTLEILQKFAGVVDKVAEELEGALEGFTPSSPELVNVDNVEQGREDLEGGYTLAGRGADGDLVVIAEVSKPQVVAPEPASLINLSDLVASIAKQPAKASFTSAEARKLWQDTKSCVHVLDRFNPERESLYS
jgi:antirestriction protein ArdC